MSRSSSPTAPAGTRSATSRPRTVDRMLRWRWWSPDELPAATEPLWPPQWPELLAAVRENGAPRTPVGLGYVPDGAAVGGP